MKLSPSERRRRILEILNSQNSVKIAPLAKEFSTSELTIRRDLDKLHNEGLLQRTFGGAEKKDYVINEFSYSKQINTMAEAKKRIGLFAAKMVQNSDVVFINSGSTNLYVARALKNKKGITIVTNSILVFIELRFSTDIELVLLGGSYRPAIFAFTGPIAEQSMKNIRANYAFLGTDGVTHQNGVTSNDFYATPIIKNMMRFSQNSILVTDHTKFGKTGPFKYADISDFDAIIVDDAIDLKEYETDGVIIHRV